VSILVEAELSKSETRFISAIKSLGGYATVRQVAKHLNRSIGYTRQSLLKLFRERKIGRVRFRKKTRGSSGVRLCVLFRDLTGKEIYYTNEDAVASLILDKLIWNSNLTQAQRSSLTQHLRRILPPSLKEKLQL